MAPTKSFPLAIQVNVPASHWDGLQAVDLFAPEGTAWLAVFDGVAESRDYPLGGHTVMLTAADGTTAYYAHGLPSRASGPVRVGQVIGYVSDSGNAKGTGCHLHFAVGSHGVDENGAGDLDPAAWLAGTPIASGGNGEAGGSRNMVAVVVIGIVALLALDALLGG